jgi:hypothetical protein
MTSHSTTGAIVQTLALSETFNLKPPPPNSALEAVEDWRGR